MSRRKDKSQKNICFRRPNTGGDDEEEEGANINGSKESTMLAQPWVDEAQPYLNALGLLQKRQLALPHTGHWFHSWLVWVFVWVSFVIKKYCQTYPLNCAL